MSENGVEGSTIVEQMSMVIAPVGPSMSRTRVNAAQVEDLNTEY
jgi:hypothetical protein